MNKTTIDRKPTIAEDLSKRIRAFKKQRPHLSSQQIAKRFDISTSSLNRIENLDIKTPSFDQIAKILIALDESDDFIEYFEANYPQVSRTVINHYQTKKTKDTLSKEFGEALRDPEYSKILLLIICQPKTTVEDIQKAFGLEGVRIIKKLQLCKLIQINNAIVTANHGDEVAIKSLEHTRDVLVSSLKESFDYDGRDAGIAENFIRYEGFALDAYKALPLISDILNEARIKIRELRKQEDLKGDDVMYFGLVADTLFPNNIKYRQKLEKENSKRVI